MLAIGAVSNNVEQVLTRKEPHVDMIRDAFRRGVFTDYETGLEKSSEWSDLLNKIVKEGNDPEEKLPVFILYLFTIAIDPKFTDERKKALFAEELKGLSKEDSDAFYKNFEYKYPTVMATHFLRYGAWWWCACKSGFYSTMANWIVEVIGNSWPIEEKQEFIKKLFEAERSEKDKILEHLIFCASDEELQAFGQVSSPALAKRLQELCEDVLGLCRRQFPNLDIWFMKWFKQKGLQHAEAAAVVATFSSNDWQQLKGTPKLTGLVVRWISEIGRHPKRREPRVDDLKVFYRCGSEVIVQGEITEEEYCKLSQSLTLQHLVSYFFEMKPKLQDAVIQRILRDEPQKLVKWLELILTWTDTVRYRSREVSTETALGKIIALFAIIKRNGLLPSALPLVFNPQVSPTLTLTVYSALDGEMRRQILSLRENTPDWTRLCASKASDLRGFVRDEFARDLSDQNAIQKIIRHFQNLGITPHERSHFLRNLRQELVGITDWLPKLVQELPGPLLPFLYLYFIVDMCGEDYHRSDPAKKGDLPTFPPWLSSVDEWVDLNVNALMQMVNNPNFTSEEDQREIHQAIYYLYYGAIKHRILVPVLQKFIEKVGPEQFVQTLNRFPQYCFYSESVFEALENANIDRLKYLGDCIESTSSRVDCFHKENRYQDCFWRLPFLQKPENCRAVAKRLIAPMGVEFLKRFYDYLPQIIHSLKDDPQCEGHFFQWVEQLCQAGLERSFSLRIFQWICKSYSEAGFDMIGLLDRKEIAKSLPKLKQWHSDWALENPDYPWSLALTVLRKLSPQSFYPTIFDKIRSRFFSYPILGNFNGLLTALDSLGCGEEFMTKLPEEKDAVASIIYQLNDKLEEFRKIASSGLAFKLLDKIGNQC